MVRLSAIVITLNEEANIGRCLDSIAGLADEIVVVDSFSTDRTGELCRERKARFLQHPFEGYVEQMQYAAAQAGYPYVLALDADEALSVRLRDAIRHVKDDFAFDGYRFNRLNHFAGVPIRHGAWYPDRKIRLWRADRGSYGGVNPHNEVVMLPGSRVGFLQGNLLHYSYKTRSELKAQTARFAEIGAREAFAQGRRAGLAGLILRPLFRFFRDFVLKRGFLDGFIGLNIAAVSASGTYLKYARLRELERRKPCA